MTDTQIKNYLVLGMIVIFLFSTISPMVLGSVLNNNVVNVSSINVDFISKSKGLDNPDKEGGKTELELADMNSDGYLDIICVGDHGSPYVNSNQHGIMVWFVFSI